MIHRRGLFVGGGEGGGGMGDGGGCWAGEREELLAGCGCE